MFNRPSTQTNQGTINKFIGSAYNDLKVIIENIDTLKSLAEVYPFTLAYLGTDVNPPTARVDGSALQDGDYYLDTTTVGGAVTYYDLLDNTWFSIDPGQILAYANSAEANAISASDDAAAIAGVLSTVNSQAAQVAADKGTVASNTTTVVGAAAQVATDTGTVTTLTADIIAAKESAVASAEAAAESEVATVNNASDVANALSSINSTASTIDTTATTIASTATTVGTTAATVASTAANIDTTATTIANTATTIASTVSVANTAAAAAVEAAEVVELLNNAPSKAEYFANCAAVDAGMNGSGFLHFGKHNNLQKHTNQGLWFYDGNGWQNRMGLGYSNPPYVTGSSTENSPTVSVLGDLVMMEYINSGNSNERNYIKLPPAPDGLDKKDGTGRFTDRAAAIVAGGSDLLASVITRDDFVFVEVWYEAIGDKGAVYVGGAVQSGLTSWNGIALQTGNAAQGYSAFGDWDTATTGGSAVWGNLTATQQALFIQDRKNGIYSDNGVLIQRRYRVRSVKGLGNDWNGFGSEYGLYCSSSSNWLQAQGGNITPNDLDLEFSGNPSYYNEYTADTNNKVSGRGMLTVRDTSGISAHDGMCYAIPIALVSRRNQGAYHPVLNSGGCDRLSKDDNWGESWGGAFSGSILPVTNVADCFTREMDQAGRTPLHDYGSIASQYGSGRPDGECYDAIYAGDIFDARKSCRKIPHAELLNRGSGMAIAAEHRGWEGCPFTKFKALHSGYFYGSNATAGNLRVAPSPSNVSVDLTNNGFPAGTSIMLWQPATGIIAYGVVSGVADHISISRSYSNLGGAVHDSSLWGNSTDIVYFAEVTLTTSKSAEPTWTTIIGDPANIAATFPDGVQGEWCPLIPDGTAKSFPLGRKTIVSSSTFQNTTDNGTTWSSNSANFNTTTNTYYWLASEISVALVNYKTKAHMTQDGVNGKVLAKGDVFASSGYLAYWGGALQSSLIGKVLTGSISGKFLDKTSIDGLVPRPDTGFLDYTLGREVTHRTFNLPTNDSPAAKCLFTLGSNNGVAVLRIPFKEMVWDSGADNGDDFINIDSNSVSAKSAGTLYHIVDGRFEGYWRCIKNISSPAFSEAGWTMLTDDKLGYSDGKVYFTRWDGNGWGDDSKFQIADGTNVMQDDNGNAAIYGIHEIELDAFIDESEL